MATNIPITERAVAEVEAEIELYRDLTILYGYTDTVDEIMKYKYSVAGALRKFTQKIRELNNNG